MNNGSSAVNGVDAGVGFIMLLMIIVVGGAFYFLPTIVAMSRKINKPAGVIALNILLGWSGIGWIAALVMAFSMETQTDYHLRTQAMMTVARMNRDGLG
ncbi:superinfection immunity protein [Gluconobacter cerinus]